MIGTTTSQPTSRSAKAAAPPAFGSQAPLPFDWPLAYEAEQLLREHMAVFLERNTFARQLADRLRAETATDFFEWADHLVLAPSEDTALRKVGFVPDPQAETPNGETVYEHPRATLPRVLLRPRNQETTSRLTLRPESVADFVARHNLSGEPEGEPFARYRRIVVAEEAGTRLEAVERRAYRGFVPAPLKRGELANIIKAQELWRTRRRLFPSDAEGIRAAHQTLDRVLDLVGPDVACQLFFEAERAYWQTRNRAARMQKHRQDQLGLGWGNHDHHTFRCSREHFVDLVAIPVEARLYQARALLRRRRSRLGRANLRTARRRHRRLCRRGLDAGRNGAGFLDAQAADRSAPGHSGPVGRLAWRESPRSGDAPFGSAL